MLTLVIVYSLWESHNVWALMTMIYVWALMTMMYILPSAFLELCTNRECICKRHPASSNPFDNSHSGILLDAASNLQVAGFLGILACAFIPAVAYPAYKAATADHTATMRGQAAGFQKAGMWKEIDRP
jgi:hypothetical protein